MKLLAIIIVMILFILAIINFLFRMPTLNITNLELAQVLVIGFFGGALIALILNRVSDSKNF